MARHELLLQLLAPDAAGGAVHARARHVRWKSTHPNWYALRAPNWISTRAMIAPSEPMPRVDSRTARPLVITWTPALVVSCDRPVVGSVTLVTRDGTGDVAGIAVTGLRLRLGVRDGRVRRAWL